MKTTAYRAIALAAVFFLSACAKPSPEQRMADAQQMYDAKQYMPLCIREMNRVGVNQHLNRRQIREMCQCTHRDITRRYGSAQEMAKSSDREFKRISRLAAERCTASYRRR